MEKMREGVETRECWNVKKNLKEKEVFELSKKLEYEREKEEFGFTKFF